MIRQVMATAGPTSASLLFSVIYGSPLPTSSGRRIRLVGDVPAPFLGSLGKPGSLVDNEPAVYTPVAGVRLCRDDGLGGPGGVSSL